MDRLRERGRQLLAWRDWPLASGILLAICAVGEALLRGFATPALIMSVVATGPLALRDRYLPTVAVMVSGATAALLALQHGVSVAGLIGQLMVLSLLAARYPRPASAVGLVPLAGNVIYPYTGSAGSRPVALLLFCLGAAAVALGYGRRKLTQVRHDNVVLAERARIARELHDVVAHHVSMMVVQAESARVGTPGLPPAGEASLTAIRDTGRQALAEMRRLVGMLRAEPGESADRAPQPGLHDLDELVAAARAAGNDVQLRREGQPQPVPAGVDVTAYRIVQEALTNVRRHAPGAPAEVLLRYADHTVQVKISDRGPGPATINRDGHGLLGMRERAAMIGGSLHTGPAPGGGYVVIADLPVREAAS
ncbi:MAG TPA: sensor histidine kinase [Streptosporangiaceae bacterium]|nr:sensor histidine kinase [Streptosporangiaceae bacterium]